MPNSEELGKVFKFLRDVSKVSRKSDTDIKKTHMNFDFKDLNKDNPYIEVNLDLESINNKPVVKISRPDPKTAPVISDDLSEWIINDWANAYEEEILVKETIEIDDGLIYFDETDLVHEFNKAVVLRNAWRKDTLEKLEAVKLFDQFYDFRREYKTLEDTHDLFFGSYLLVSSESRINFPLVMRPAKVSYNIEDRTIELVSNEEGTRFNNHLLDEISGLDMGKFKEINDEFLELDIHPFDYEMVEHYVVNLINSLTPKSRFVKAEDRAGFIPSDQKLIVYEDNFMLLSRRPDSVVEFLNSVSEEAELGALPSHLNSFIDANANKITYTDEEPSFEEKLANLGGESKEILLAKEANEEQLNIIKRLDLGHSGVLVQGPPGTGKTHTIANITGHFLSEGKTVLITSHTKKALNVLKEKLPEELRDLAVSLVDDNKEDLEKSVNKISEMISSSDVRRLNRNIERYENERIHLINELANTRRQILNIKVEESEAVVYKNQSYTYSELAKHIYENEEKLNIIPGRVEASETMPLSLDELELLYKTNELVSKDDQDQFTLGLVNPNDLIKPNNFNDFVNANDSIDAALLALSQYTGQKFEYSAENNNIRYKRQGVPYLINNVDEYIEKEVHNFFERSINVKEWHIDAIIAGKRDGNYRQVWNNLVSQINLTKTKTDEYYQLLFLKNYEYKGELSIQQLRDVLLELKNSDASLNFTIQKRLNKNYRDVHKNFYIEGKPIDNSSDYEVAFAFIDQKIEKDITQRLWDELIGGYQSTERAHNTVREIEYFLNWHKNTIEMFKNLNDRNFNIKHLVDYSTYKSDKDLFEAVFKDIENLYRPLTNIVKSISALDNYTGIYHNSVAYLHENSGAILNQELLKKLEINDVFGYEELFDEVTTLYRKEANIKLRDDLVRKLHTSAPGWARAIRNREGIHGLENPPQDIEMAWDYKQYSRIIDDVLSINYNDLLDKSFKNGRKLREKTAQLAAEKAWLELVMKTKEDRSLQSSLQKWKLNMDKIGKGTGKRANRYRKQARQEMKRAQKAIPVWIMPMNEVMNNMTPGENKFDIVIVDEASQSDITALGVLALGEKVIVVGDDKQVSPTTFAKDEHIVNARNIHFSKEEVDNYNLWEPETSLYDLAHLVYEPLMLKEHFRCVPEIIDFSSYDSYDGNIKALRGSNTAQVYPPVVEFRVKDGEVNNSNVNQLEAQNIASLIYGMTQTKKYNGLSIGVITMKSSPGQVDLINREIRNLISPEEIENRNIIVGNPSYFQGDERDVILLSMIDSNEKETPLSLFGSGPNDNRKKRYNVAASRARDQMWVVHSLDLTKDLRSDDYRRRIIEHARYPYKNEEKIEKLSDSIFEEEVARALIGRGYRIEQQKAVGPYRIDIVVSSDDKEIALELDGEAYHGPDQFESDLERQTVLERVGWDFIRLRGSEYFRNPEQAVERICDDFSKYGIEPTFDDDNYKLKKQAKLTDEVKDVLKHSAKVLEVDLDEYKHNSIYAYTSLLEKEKITEDLTPVQKEVQLIVKPLQDKKTLSTESSENEIIVKDKVTNNIGKELEEKDIEDPAPIKKQKPEVKKVKSNSKPKVIKDISELNNAIDQKEAKYKNDTTSHKKAKDKELIDKVDEIITQSNNKAKKNQAVQKSKAVETSKTIDDTKPVDVVPKKEQHKQMSSIERFNLRQRHMQDFSRSERQKSIDHAEKTKQVQKERRKSERKSKTVNKSTVQNRKIEVKKYSYPEQQVLKRNLEGTGLKVEVKNYHGIISKKGDWTKELNEVSWNNGRTSFDIRSWGKNHTQIGKGITLSKSELRRLHNILKEM